MKLKTFQRKMCAISCFLATILYVLVSYYTSCYTWTLFFFLLIPLMPVLVGLKKVSLSYDLLVVISYLVLGISQNGWHPWWVLFLTIPIYHIFIDDCRKKKKENIDIKIKVEDDDIEIIG